MDLSWRENLKIGVEKVDNQHKEIFKRLEKLFDACSEGKGDKEVMHLIEFLENYVIEHFRDEEELQIRSKYPEFTAHKKEHTSFFADVQNFKGLLKNGSNQKNYVLQIHQLVSQWLVDHISNTDRAFGVFYRQKLLQTPVNTEI